MRDVELYRAILGLEAPWTVTSVDLDVKGEQVMVRVEAGPGPFPCPECETPGPRYDSKPRRWRHLDTCQFTTWIETEIPRVQCPTHGVKQVRVPWAEPGSQFTVLFERWAIALLRECSVEPTFLDLPACRPLVRLGRESGRESGGTLGIGPGFPGG